eukprot:CAMPEP_0205906336 /NCGR_PEP_ID=MMETSP1325-20131115/1894_1 /ASSEMBLY_ACC=CAM_ASM_000708 /TAXON_ID=236786 /ORGANISM="Florenciella sp., Strain RCC1007" /LENGTH=135 /DNA_ID=CAMNT_0053272339 /DNA_START=1 /DNA_END=405 /DNA_ORIENTATION=-
MWTSSTEPLDRQTYLQALLSAVFALVPAGNNPETFRHWEAFALGAIPVSVKPPDDRSYLSEWCSGGGGEDGRGAFGEWTARGLNDSWCPMVLLGSWDELPAFLASATQSHHRSHGHGAQLDALQAQMVRWHSTFR